jgi:tetratricopeptide (TPR) repeat protein
MPNIRSLSIFLLIILIHLACASGGPPQGGRDSAVVTDPDSLVAAGQSAAGEGNYALAKQMFDAALVSESGNAGAYRGLARIYVATGDPASAIHYYEKLLEHTGGLPEDYTEMAGVMVKAGRGDEALLLVTEAVTAHPDNAQLCAELGSLLLDRGQTDKAVRQLRRAVDLGAGRNAHGELARALFNTGQYDEAVDVLQSYNERYPGDFDVNMELAYIYLDRGDHKNALPHYRAAVEANPKSIDARVGLAKTLEALDRIDSAIRVYDEALEIRGLIRQMEPVIIAQANLLIKRGKYTRALELVESAAENFPETPGLACARGMALAGEGHYEQAISAFSLATGDPRWSEFANAQIRRIQSISRGH